MRRWLREYERMASHPSVNVIGVDPPMVVLAGGIGLAPTGLGLLDCGKLARHDRGT